jgi:hypothetical protein
MLRKESTIGLDPVLRWSDTYWGVISFTHFCGNRVDRGRPLTNPPGNEAF